MPKHRLAFSKADTAKFISHLDLMRTFQRSFLRAGIAIKHTEGFNPHAFVSIPLPLSVGFSSGCEVLERQVLDTPLDQVPVSCRQTYGSNQNCGRSRKYRLYQHGRKPGYRYGYQ